MTSFLWALAVYVVAYAFLTRSGLIALGNRDEKRVILGLILVLAGIHATAVRTGAADVAANPIVLETAIRGLADTLAFLFVFPIVARGMRHRRSRLGVGGSALIAYATVAGISTLYSADAIVTAAKAYELGVGLALVLAASVIGPDSRASLFKFVRITVLLESALVVVAVLGFFALPGIFSQVQTRPGFILRSTMVSPYAHSNGLSSSGALVAAYALAMFFESRPSRARVLWGALAAVATVGVILASGRQGVVIWIASLLVLLWFERRQLLVLLIAPASTTLVLMYWSEVTHALIRNQSLATLSTWSGRLTFWEAALNAWVLHPWLGYGFGVGGRFVVLRSIGADRISSLHSGYFEALTGLGLSGLVLLLIPVTAVTIWAVRSLKSHSHVAEALLIVPLLLRTLVSTGFGGWLTGTFMVLAALALISDTQRRRPHRQTGHVGTGARYFT